MKLSALKKRAIKLPRPLGINGKRTVSKIFAIAHVLADYAHRRARTSSLLLMIIDDIVDLLRHLPLSDAKASSSSEGHGASLVTMPAFRFRRF